MQTITLGDFGSAVRVTIYDETNTIVDISGANNKQIIFRRPNGTILIKTATLTTTGTDGKMQYALAQGDIDIKGRWELQGYVDIGAGLYSTIDEFLVIEPLGKAQLPGG